LRYKEITDNPNVPAKYKSVEGYPLGIWQSVKRHNYKKGNLSQGWIKRLEEIGFKWDIQEEKFKKGMQESLLYKEITGNPNTPRNYKTPEGYRLSSWQNVQRINYSKGKLSPDRIKRLGLHP